LIPGGSYRAEMVTDKIDRCSTRLSAQDRERVEINHARAVGPFDVIVWREGYDPAYSTAVRLTRLPADRRLRYGAL